MNELDRVCLQSPEEEKLRAALFCFHCRMSSVETVWILITVHEFILVLFTNLSYQISVAA